MSKEEKNNNIKTSIKETKSRHSNMECRVFEVKITKNKMNLAQKEALHQMFTEAKWMRNYVLSDTKEADRNAKSVPVKVNEDFEEKTFTILGSQMKQDIYDKVYSEIKGLATKKEKGEKVGALKFKSYCNCIPLRQYGTTYRIDFNKNTIKIQNIKKPFKVRGLNQLKDKELTNAVLLRKPDGYYIHITGFTPKEIKKYDSSVGVDFGIQHNLTLSNGETYDISVKESKSVKLLSRKMNRSFVKNGRKKSNRHKKRKHKQQIAYQKDARKRLDAANKAYNKIIQNDYIAIQDEMIHNWHKGLFGKQVQHSAMGYIKAKLKTNSRVHVVEQSFPSTQICPVCNELTKHPLRIRYYKCEHCGYYHPSRDIKSAQSILDYALSVSTEHRA